MSMFTYQTVRRNELQSPRASPRSSPDPQLAARLRLRFSEFTFTPLDAEDSNDADRAPEDDDDEADIVLFAGPASSAPQPQKIRLQSPDAEAQPGFAVKRPRSYYFADAGDSDREAEFEAAAIDADTIRALAALPWPGCAVPWKVTKISAAGLQKSVLVGHPPMLLSVEEKAERRKRKGKKARIALRKQMKAREEQKVVEEKAKKEKEEAEREKKTRRNREKKLKKKAKEKAEKNQKVDGTAGDMDAPDKMEIDSDSEQE